MQAKQAPYLQVEPVDLRARCGSGVFIYVTPITLVGPCTAWYTVSMFQTRGDGIRPWNRLLTGNQ